MAEAKPPRPRNVLLAEFPGLSKDDASQALRDAGGARGVLPLRVVARVRLLDRPN